jgi:replicative DNA helicase
MNFESIISQIERNKAIKDAGGITSIAPPFARLAQYYGGFTKGSITCITAASGVGKSKFAKYMTIVNIYKATRNTEITPKIF